LNKFIKNTVLGLSLATATIMFSGCEAVKQINSALGIANTPQEYIQKSSDKYLAQIFSQYFDGKNNIRTSGNPKEIIGLQAKIINFNEMVKQRDGYDQIERRFEQDEIVKVYQDAIINRGNSYKVYKNYLNKELLKALLNAKGEFKTQDKIAKYAYDWTPCIVEYDKNEKIVSAMVRYQEIAVAYNNFSDPYAPIQVESQILIVTDYKARSLQNRVSNRLFEDNLLYESK